MPLAINVILGTASFGYKPTGGLETLSDKAAITHILEVFKKHGGYQLDSARSYGESTTETILGELDLQGFKVDTKVRSMTPGCHKAELVHKSVAESLAELKTTKVNILYLHAPDRATPFAETLQAINEEHKKGAFAEFGLSNFKVEEVEEVVEIATKNGFVKPTVYQGSYNLFARKGETELFPTLRKHGIKFYAYSPLAGSLLTDTDPASLARFDKSARLGLIYSNQYMKEPQLKALELLREVGAKHGLGVQDIALRWLAHHSHLKHGLNDAIITGGRKVENIERTLVIVEKPTLPADVLKVVEEVWELVKADAVAYHF